jgi:hypothetical protein
MYKNGYQYIRYNNNPLLHYYTITHITHLTHITLLHTTHIYHTPQVIPYTRNLIATDEKEYTLLLLCWSAGIEVQNP